MIKTWGHNVFIIGRSQPLYDEKVVISENLVQQCPQVREQDLIVFSEHVCHDFCLTFVNWDHE